MVVSVPSEVLVVPEELAVHLVVALQVVPEEPVPEVPSPQPFLQPFRSSLRSFLLSFLLSFQQPELPVLRLSSLQQVFQEP